MTSPGAPSASVVLPTRNRCHILPAAVESILHQSQSNLELILVDDGSTDQTWTYLCRLASEVSNVKIMRHPFHLGLAEAMNDGVSGARSDLVFMFGDRLEADPVCVENLIGTFVHLRSQGHMVGAVGPRFDSLFDPAPRSPVRPRDAVVACGAFTGEIYHDFSLEVPRPIPVPQLHAYALLDRQLLVDAGGYSSKYRGSHWRIESDLYFRLRRRGYELFFESRAVVHPRNVRTGGSRSGRFEADYYLLVNHSVYLSRSCGFRALYMIPAYTLLSMIPKGILRRALRNSCI